MVYKYLYIDDAQNSIEQGTINALEDGNEIAITFKKPNNWEIQINDLISIIPEFDGIILDLRLNDNPYIENKFAQYRGSTVAQELRTLAKEKAFKNDFPIVLISADENLHISLDQTSWDLFDFCVSKNKLEQINGLSFADFREKLKWLADGYKLLNRIERNLQNVFDIKDTNFLDIRFTDDFNRMKDNPVHVIARFIIKQILEKPTFLINENYLSARLGIDKNSDDWNTLLDEYLSPFKYSGAFSNYYPRWWMSEIESYWETNISKEEYLRNISAERRVELIIAKTGLKKLTPLIKQEKSKSDSFWVVCKGSRVALDTIDGFTIAGQDDNFPWQEPEYISIDEALRPKRIDLWKNIASLEKPRLQRLKQMLEKNE